MDGAPRERVGVHDHAHSGMCLPSLGVFGAAQTHVAQNSEQSTQACPATHRLRDEVDHVLLPRIWIIEVDLLSAYAQ